MRLVHLRHNLPPLSLHPSLHPSVFQLFIWVWVTGGAASEGHSSSRETQRRSQAS